MSERISKAFVTTEKAIPFGDSNLVILEARGDLNATVIANVPEGCQIEHADHFDWYDATVKAVFSEESPEEFDILNSQRSGMRLGYVNPDRTAIALGINTRACEQCPINYMCNIYDSSLDLPVKPQSKFDKVLNFLQRTSEFLDRVSNKS